jgi:alpha-beta hydrolase superfamily lysophospholipase
MKSKKVSFPNKYGIKLCGYIDYPGEHAPEHFALFSHCFTCSKNLKSIANLNSALSRAGIASLRFDFTGIGESGGNFTDTNYSLYIDDLISASEFLAANYKPPSLVIGHSLGGCAAIESVCKIPSIRAVVTIGTPAEPSKLSEKLKTTKEKAEAHGFAEKTIGGKKYKFSKQFFDDIEQHKLEPYIRNLKKPLLILQSPVDSYTPFENAGLIYKAAGEPKSIISLDGFDHLLLKKEDAVYAGELIAVWSKKYLKR